MRSARSSVASRARHAGAPPAAPSGPPKTRAEIEREVALADAELSARLDRDRGDGPRCDLEPREQRRKLRLRPRPRRRRPGPRRRRPRRRPRRDRRRAGALATGRARRRPPSARSIAPAVTSAPSGRTKASSTRPSTRWSGGTLVQRRSPVQSTLHEIADDEAHERHGDPVERRHHGERDVGRAGRRHASREELDVRGEGAVMEAPVAPFHEHHAHLARPVELQHGALVRLRDGAQVSARRHRVGQLHEPADVDACAHEPSRSARGWRGRAGRSRGPRSRGSSARRGSASAPTPSRTGGRGAG